MADKPTTFLLHFVGPLHQWVRQTKHPCSWFTKSCNNIIGPCFYIFGHISYIINGAVNDSHANFCVRLVLGSGQYKLCIKCFRICRNEILQKHR